MKIGLFIPCYVDVVYPEVGVATYKLLKHLGLDVDYPQNQTCCGQPMANAGFENQAIPLAEKFEDIFKGFDYVVSPSVSCTAFIRLNYPRLLKGKTECQTAQKAIDVVEFLHDIVKVNHPLGTFPHKVSLHNSCHGVRELGLSSPSEKNIPKYNKIKDLLNLVEGIQIFEPERADECCGFGGMFSIEETSISEQMGIDKVQRHQKTGARFVTGPDCSCLMHMAGVAKKHGLDVEFMHVVEILAAGL
ncbi:(Fe-S)-binding protein [Prevotella sp. MA2016]|uniref:(Fe-S)-binding protein n=1 Tax=Prevotella sp. MA2016 TaxID=1408310 RepID=UPI00048FC754|nr:(Fe-S)-binding protein [Prevotella sp. MA2016]